MRQGVLGTVAVLFAVTVVACGKDKEPRALQQAAPAAPESAAPATKTATPRPAPPGPEAVAAAELASASRVRTVQVAALPDATARWWVTELQKQGIPAYATTAVVDGQEVTRLRIGAAVSGAEARAIAEKIRARYHWPTWIVMVDDKSALPPNALLASRNYASP